MKIGTVVVEIILTVVGVVILQEVLASFNFTGILGTIMTYVPILLGLSVLAYIAITAFSKGK